MHKSYVSENIYFCNSCTACSTFRPPSTIGTNAKKICLGLENFAVQIYRSFVMLRFLLFHRPKHFYYFPRFFCFPREKRIFRISRSSRPIWPTGSCDATFPFFLFFSTDTHYSHPTLSALCAHLSQGYEAPKFQVRGEILCKKKKINSKLLLIIC